MCWPIKRSNIFISVSILTWVSDIFVIKHWREKIYITWPDCVLCLQYVYICIKTLLWQKENSKKNKQSIQYDCINYVAKSFTDGENKNAKIATKIGDQNLTGYFHFLCLIVIYKALCFDVAQGRMKGAPNETLLVLNTFSLLFPLFMWYMLAYRTHVILFLLQICPGSLAYNL